MCRLSPPLFVPPIPEQCARAHEADKPVCTFTRPRSPRVVYDHKVWWQHDHYLSDGDEFWVLCVCVGWGVYGLDSILQRTIVRHAPSCSNVEAYLNERAKRTEPQKQSKLPERKPPKSKARSEAGSEAGSEPKKV